MSAPADIAAVLDGTARWCVVEGDNREVLPALADGCIDVTLTDPPYSEHVHGKQRRVMSGSGGRVCDGQRAGRGNPVSKDLGFAALTAEHRAFCASEFARLTRRWVLCFSDLESTHLWQRDLEAAGLQHIRVGVWNKLCGQPQLTGDRPAVGCEGIEIAHRQGRKRWNGGGLPARWDHQIATDRNGTGERWHTTQKPLPLAMEILEQFSEPGDLVLDAFAGSFTFAVACLRLGRRCISIELDPVYAAAGRDRLAAEVQGLTLTAARAGQMSLLGER